MRAGSTRAHLVLLVTLGGPAPQAPADGQRYFDEALPPTLDASPVRAGNPADGATGDDPESSHRKSQF